MGVGVSDWRLARAVSLRGELGVVSGTGIDTLLVRRLQDGDPGGHVRRAMRRFPIPHASEDALRRYFNAHGRPPLAPYRVLPKYKQVVSKAREELTMLAAFVEVYLAKEGHESPVGMNLLTKVQLPNLALLYGAMLAGVDYVLMGAGLPRGIPGALDLLTEHRPASLRFEVQGVPAGETLELTIDPRSHWEGTPPEIRRPRFLAIVASNSLATLLSRKTDSRVDGFVIEGPSGGGHNAPPRGEPKPNERGEPSYGIRDVVDLEKIREIGVPFWIAGGAGWPERLREALDAGAAGIQVGTLFAYCEESGLIENLKRSVLSHAARGEVDVITDSRASPTGYPFKIVRWRDDPAAGVVRERICDVGGLRVPYLTSKGQIGYRCPAEPVDDYVRKGGRVEETEGRACLCNALMANIGLGQVRAGGWHEPPMVTSGHDLNSISAFLEGRTHYSAADVIDYLLSAVAA
ncbi:MAG TPA: nitronate monooxygenase [Candidatus Eisenbacteria bacterium]|nr:nitronate monooxygenase [Candidatus Eisenbacteria bacterium]